MQLYVPWAGTFLRRVREDRVDLLHLTTPGPVGLVAMLVAWKTGLPLIGSFHTDLAAYTERLSGSQTLGRLMRQYLRWPYGRCARILVPSNSTRRLLLDSRVDEHKLALWMRGVDAQLFSPSKRSAALRNRWRVSDRRPAIIYAGRLSKEKGLARLPEVVSALHRHGLEHRLVLVGDGPFRKELELLLPDAIFTGTLGAADVAVALASADLFVFPSETDSAGNVVLEAQASGLPVVVTDAGGPREYVRPDITGLVCATTDEHSLPLATTSLLHDAQRRRAMAEAAREHALTLTWESALAPLYRAYLEIGGLHAADASGRQTPRAAGATA